MVCTPYVSFVAKSAKLSNVLDSHMERHQNGRLRMAISQQFNDFNTNVLSVACDCNCKADAKFFHNDPGEESSHDTESFKNNTYHHDNTSI